MHSAASGDFITRLNTAFGAIAGWSFDHRWAVLALALAMLVASLIGAASAQVDSSFEAYFDPADPIYVDYERYREDFGSDEVSYILYDAPNAEQGPFDLDVMTKIAHLTRALEDEVPFVYEVESLASAERMVGLDDGIEIRSLRDEMPLTQAELLALRDVYLNKPLFVGGLLSADARHGAIIIQMDRSSTDPLDEIRLDPEAGDGLENLYPQVTNTAIDAILERPEYEGIRFFHSGDVPMNAVYNEVIGTESTRLSAITSLVIALLLLVFFRSVVGVIAPIAVVQLSVIMTVALVAALGWKLDMSFSSMPTLLTAIGVAHSVHILSEFRGRFSALRDRRAALVETIYLVGTPCLLTSVTTAVGFASMSFVPIKSISHQGLYAAFGVLAAFVLSMTLLMALLSFGRPEPGGVSGVKRSADGDSAMQAGLDAIATFTMRRRIALLVSFALVFAVSLAGITRMSVDSNWLDDFSDRLPLKATTTHVDDVMGGVTNLILLFDGGASGAIKEPAALREIERLQRWADRQDLVRKSYSLVDILKDLNQTFHEDRPEWNRLPETRNLVAQYLILYESAGGSEADEYVSSDYRNAALQLRLRLGMTSETAELVDALENELRSEPLAATTMSLTGIGALWLKLLDYIVSSQIEGFVTAFSIISLLMILLFRSLKTGLIAMIPNLFPVILTLGAMGWLDIPLDYNKVSIAAVAMGIAVDDTIHLVSRYRHEFRACGRYEDALRAALLDVGRALMITSVCLVLGFLVLILSLLDSQALQGMLLATTIVTALVADFLLMPALVLTFQPFGPEGLRESGAEQLSAAA